MPFSPFIKTGNSEDRRNILMLIQIRKSRLNKCFERCRIFIIQNNAIRPCIAIGLIRSAHRRNISGSRVPPWRKRWKIRYGKVIKKPMLKKVREISSSHSIIRQFDILGLVIISYPSKRIVRTGSIITNLFRIRRIKT